MRHDFLMKSLIVGTILLVTGVSFTLKSDPHNAFTPGVTPLTDATALIDPLSTASMGSGWDIIYSTSGTQETRDVCLTLSGNEYVAVGRSYVSQWRPFLLKTNSQGQQLWFREYGPWSLYDAAWCVTPTKDGGFVMGGKVQHVGGGDADDILVFKTDANGNLLWKKEHDIAGYFDRMWDLLELSDGSLVGCGSLSPLPTYHDAGLVKMNSQGEILWYRCYGQPGTTEDARVLTATIDGGFLIGGYYGWGNGDLKNRMYLIKTDASGNVIWSKILGDANVWNEADWVGQTRGGNYIVAGRTGEASFGTKGWVLKLDPDGDILWEKIIGGNYNDWFTGGIIKANEDCLLVGLTQSYSSDPGTSDTNRDGWLLRLNTKGDKLGENVYGTPGVREQFAGIKGPGADDRYIVGGSSGGNVYMVKPEGVSYNPDDLVVRNSYGDLLLFPFENGTFGSSYQVGHGWNFTHYFVGNWICNGTNDLIVRNSNSQLILYPYRNETFYTYGSKVVGQNFNYSHYLVGNWTNNGTDDLIVIDSSGNMWLFPFDNEAFGPGQSLGSGWNYTHYFVGNWSGNGTHDLIARDSSGSMWYFVFDNGAFNPRYRVGNGWNFTHYFVGHWTNDGTDDLIVRDSYGRMRLYPFRNGSFYYVPGAGKIVATGWNFTDYFVGDWKNNTGDDMIVRDLSGNLFLYPFENETFGTGSLVGGNFYYTHYLWGSWTDDD
jgi:hypothetical protein